MSADPSAPRSRRSVLAAALGGLGAVVASRLASPGAASAAPGDAVVVDAAKTGAGTTSIDSTITGGPAFAASGVGEGLRGTSPGGAGVVGAAGNLTTLAAPAEVGVYGHADGSATAYGVAGESENGIGVRGAGPYGVFGDGYFGVYAYGQVAVTGDAGSAQTGVYGFTGDDDAPLPPAGVGVVARAETTAQTALQVYGKAKFSRSGRTYVATNASSRKITMTGVTTASYIIATLQTRRTGVYVHAVVPAAGSFTIYLNKAVSSTTYVGYLVIN